LTSGPEPATAGSAADEPVEVLGPGGEVVEVVPRSRMRSEGLAHRSTFIITVLAAPPSEGAVDLSLSDHLEGWLRELSWPLLGPRARGDVRPAPVPPELRPAVALSPDTPLVVHRRAEWKDVYPGYWDLAFGGVCAVGERWLESAERELAEEAGLPTRATVDRADAHTVPVLPVAAGRYVDDRAETFGAIFVAFSDREPAPVDGEVVALDHVPLGELAVWVEGRPICPDSKAMVVPVVSSLLASPE